MPKKKPDEFHMHEALHMSSFLMQAVATELCEHVSIAGNKKFSKLADRAHSALFDLYQAIGKAHIIGEGERRV